MELQKKIWVLIQRFVTGNATPRERKIMQDWMDKSRDNEKLVREIEEIWKMTTKEDFDVNAELAWEKFKNRVHRKPFKKSGEQIQNISKPYQKNSDVFAYAMRVAAVILVIILAGSFSYYLGNNSSLSEVAEKPEFYQMQEMITSRGEKAKVRFSDGTEVILNSASSIKFPKEFQNSIREVFLNGEALFKVAHDPNQPFIVHAQDAKIQVLGTEFNVKGREEDEKTEIVVSEGKVSVNSNNPEINSDTSEVILTKGFKTELIRGQAPEPAIPVDSNYYLLWTSGGMHFDNTPIPIVFKDIERRFDVNISVEREEILNVSFTSTFQYAELDEVLSVIAVSLGIEYTRNERDVRFH